ncbi:MAG: putative metallopeptidase [Thermoproteota archaeon]
MPRVFYAPSQPLSKILRILIRELGLTHIDPDRVYAAWSFGSSTRAYARIWGVPSPFAKLGLCRPSYVVEAVYERFSRLSCREALATLLHELMHIPKSFSGSLRPHGRWTSPTTISSALEKVLANTADSLCSLLDEALREAEQLCPEKARKASRARRA